MRIRTARTALAPERLQMSSMIDIVFLLLVFFVMTFQIVAIEGDLEIAAPRAPAVDDSIDVLPPQSFHVRLEAAADGSLEGVYFDQRALADVDGLHAFVRQIVAEHVAIGRSREELSVVLHCDDHLHYAHTVAAISAIRGYVANGEIHELIRTIRFN